LTPHFKFGIDIEFNFHLYADILLVHSHSASPPYCHGPDETLLQKYNQRHYHFMKASKQIPQVLFFCLLTTFVNGQSTGQLTTSPESLTVTMDIADKGSVVRNVMITNPGTENVDFYVTSRRKSLPPSLTLSSSIHKVNRANGTTRKSSEPSFRRHGKRDWKTLENHISSLDASPYLTHGTSLFAKTADPKIVELDPVTGNELRPVAFPEFFDFVDDIAYTGTTIYSNDLFSISSFDAVSGAMLAEVDLQSIFQEFTLLFDIAHDGEYLYAITGGQEIMKIDFDGRRVVGTIPLSFSSGEGLAHRGNLGTFFVTDNSSTHIYEVDITTGATLNTFDLGDTHYFTSLTYSSTADVLFGYDEFDPENTAIVVLDARTGDILNVIPTDIEQFYYGGGLGADESYSGVFVTDRNTKTLSSGETISIPVEFSVRELLADTYEYEILVTTDDPANPDAIIPATLQVTGGQSKFVSDQTQLNFGSVFVTQNKKLKLKVTNQSTNAVLRINSISTNSDRFIVDKTEMRLNPTLDNFIEVTYTPSNPGNDNAVLHLETNDPSHAIVEIPLLGLAVAPPVIQVDKNSIDVSINPGQTQTVSLRITNAGNSVLSWAAGLESKDASLEPLLKRLNEGYSRITSKIPSRYDFAGGVAGSSIDKSDEPDLYGFGGNTIFAIDFQGVKILSYTNGQISNQEILGGNGLIDGKYFTTKHTGLFSFAADTDSNEFEISGSLSGKQVAVDGVDLKTNQRGVAFHGFVKRVYGPNALSLNHLFIIQERASAKHIVSTNPNVDNHNAFQSGFDLGSIHRVYYLVFASQAGTYVDDNAMTNIMNEFLRTVAYPEWGNVISSSSGNTDPLQGNNLQIKFDPAGLSPGLYETVLSIVSNDPNRSEIKIPVRLTVNKISNGAPQITAPLPGRVISRQEEFTIRPPDYFQDPNAEDLNYSIQASAPDNVSINQVDDTSYKITGRALGTTSITITASNSSGAAITQSFDLQILNRDPVQVSPIEDPTISINEEITIDLGVHFSDPDNDPLTIVAQQLSAGLIELGPVIDNKIKVKGKSAGLAGIILSILDPSGVSAKHANLGKIFHVQVNPNHAPTLVSPFPEMSILIEQEITIDLAEHFSDADGEVITITAESATDFVQVLSFIDNKLKLKGKNPGSAPIVITASDPSDTKVSQTFNINVALENHAPVPGNDIPTKTIFVEQEISINLSEHFSDEDGDRLVYTATTTPSENISLRIEDNLLFVKGNVAGEQTINVTATDPFMTTANQSFQVAVNDLVLQVREGEEMVYSFTPNPFTEMVRFSISIPEDTYIQLSIMDALGKLVMTPMSGVYSKGEVNEAIRLVDCSPGIYYYSLFINGFAFSGKLVKYGH
jgi:hypothetical protein